MDLSSFPIHYIICVSQITPQSYPQIRCSLSYAQSQWHYKLSSPYLAHSTSIIYPSTWTSIGLDCPVWDHPRSWTSQWSSCSCSPSYEKEPQHLAGCCRWKPTVSLLPLTNCHWLLEVNSTYFLLWLYLCGPVRGSNLDLVLLQHGEESS